MNNDIIYFKLILKFGVLIWLGYFFYHFFFQFLPSFQYIMFSFYENDVLSFSLQNSNHQLATISVHYHKCILAHVTLIYYIGCYLTYKLALILNNNPPSIPYTNIILTRTLHNFNNFHFCDTYTRHCLLLRTSLIEIL